MRRTCLKSCLYVATVLLVSACGGGGGGNSSPSVTTYTVGGLVSGLGSGKSVVLQNNGGDNLTVSANESFTFSTSMADSTGYAVTVLTHPLGQYCTVSGGNGTIAGANFTSVTVSCATQMGGALQGKTPALSGPVSTLAGTPFSQDDTGAAANFGMPVNAVATGGSLFITDNSLYVIRKVDLASGVVTTLAGKAGYSGATNGTGTSARFSFPSGIATDGTYLYVTDRHAIRRIEISTGSVITFAGSPGVSGSTDAIGTSARFNFPYGITTDGTNLYVADTSNHSIRQVVISSGVVTTIAGIAGSFGSTDATGTAAQFRSPSGITTDGACLYIADTGNSTIRQMALGSGVVTTIAGLAGAGDSVDGTGSAARFINPFGIIGDGTNLYVADKDSHTIRQIVISTGVVTTLAGAEGITIAGSIDGAGSTARFNSPYGIASDGTNLYVVDSGNHTIRQIALSTAAVTTISSTASGNDGIGAVARFGTSAGALATDGTYLYLADRTNHIIRRIEIATGAVTTLAGKAGVPGNSNGIGTAARFNTPRGITTDGVNLYVLDTSNYTVRKIETATGAVTTFAGGAGVSGSADGTGTLARFYNPNGITTDGINLFVADSGNHTIRQIVIATGSVTTIAGTAGASGSSDGTGSAARFFIPWGITTDGMNLYIADYFNNTIRQIVISTGVVTTIAGTAGSSGSSDGTGSVARFKSPVEVTTDGTNIYVADSGNHAIRQIIISSGVVSTIAGIAGSPGVTDGSVSSALFSGPTGITTDTGSLYITDGSNGTIRRIQ